MAFVIIKRIVHMWGNLVICYPTVMGKVYSNFNTAIQAKIQKKLFIINFRESGKMVK